MIEELAKKYMEHIEELTKFNGRKRREIPQTCTGGGVRSTEEMDCAINDLNSKLASMFTALDEIRSAIVGGGNHPNHKSNEHGNPRFRTNYEGFYDNHGVTNPQNEFGDMKTSCFQMRKEKKPLRSSIGVLAEAFEGYGCKAVLEWLYEVDNFFDIMDVPEEEQAKFVVYKLCGGVGAWWQRGQDNCREQSKRRVDT
ncbi:hypothetical protein Tco_1148637 [Tanacetum coccineum]